MLRRHKSGDGGASAGDSHTEQATEPSRSAAVQATLADDALLESAASTDEHGVQLHSLVNHAIILHRLDVDWALLLGGWVWALAAVVSALCTPSYPRLMFLVALTMVWGSCTVALFPASGPLTWLVHFLVAGSEATHHR